MIVVPDILESDLGEVGVKIDLIREVSDGVHIDIIDGLFADNITVSVADLYTLELGDLNLDLHLIVDDPMEYLEECYQLKPFRVIAQIEKMGSQGRFVDAVKEKGLGVGLALDLYTPIDSLESEILNEVDAILLMSVNVGWSGQKFKDSIVEKVKELRSYYNGSIIIDGGMNPKTAHKVIEAGASEVAVNSYLWDGDINKKIKEFK